jgi:hypothetical protein
MPASTEERLKGGITFPMDSRGSRVSTFNTVEKKRIWRTLDTHLLPFVSLLYLLSFL